VLVELGDAEQPNATAPEPADGGGIREVKSAARTVELLELLAARRHQPMRLREISEQLKAPRSSIYALIRTLLDRGWVRTDPTGTLYSIGIQALLAGTTYLDVDPILRIVQPQIGNLSVQLDETIHYGRLQGTDVVYLATHESSQYLRPFSRVGRRLPAFTTAMGKALLAEQLRSYGEQGLAAHLPQTLTPLTPKTVVDGAELRTQLEETQSRGFAVDEEENVPGTTCYAVALRFGGAYLDAISCSVPIERLSNGREEEIVRALRAAKHTLELMAPGNALHNYPGI
jgi:DNA-binding IclR family transcriptional regulator